MSAQIDFAPMCCLGRAHNGFGGFARGLLHVLARCPDTDACAALYRDLPRNMRDSDAFNNHPTIAALGHACEQIASSRSHVFQNWLVNLFKWPRQHTKQTTARPIELDVYVGEPTLQGTRVAHGNLFHLATGIAPLGSWKLSDWLRQYIRALMALTDATKTRSLQHVRETVETVPFFDFFKGAWPQMFPGSTFSLALDLKSIRSSQAPLLIKVLLCNGVKTDSVSAISRSSFAGVAVHCPDVKLITSFASLSSIRTAVRTGKITSGATCTFNGGELVRKSGAEFHTNRAAVAIALTLESRGVHLSAYVDEGKIDTNALAVVQTAAQDAGIEFAYGGVNGIVFAQATGSVGVGMLAKVAAALV